MKNILLKFYITVICLFSTVIMFAEPGEGNDVGNLESADAPAASINEQLFTLAIIGVIFAFYFLKKTIRDKSFSSH